MSLGRVLVIDDETEIRLAVKAVLKKEGYDVIEAEDGEKGVAKAKAGDNPLMLNAIICDLQMPKMGGMDAIPSLRKQFPSCPVIVLSGTATVDKANILFKQGVIEVLTKPIDNKALIAAVKKAVGQSGHKDQFST
jgi:DNA-binding NtrC family response regulator